MFLLLSKFWYYIGRISTIMLSKFWYSFIFHKFGKGSCIVSPLLLLNSQNISIGNNTSILYKAYLAATPINKKEEAKLIIGNNCSIGNFNHIYCTRSITIGNNVLTADKVYISDNLHSYEDIHTPVIKQPLKQMNPVVIGDGTWLGENVCVIGAKIGKNCVIGANSVVTKDIPNYCVAVGAPTKVIKKFNIEKNTWERV